MGKMRGTGVAMLVVLVALSLGAAAWNGRTGAPEPGAPHVSAVSSVAAGRYLVIVGQCNDCHTPGWMDGTGDVPESAWLTGLPVGFKGPWGTSYPRNLRLTVASMSEDAFVARLRAGAGLPPMPWVNVSRLAEDDMRAIYRYIASLGPAGQPAPMPVAPGVEPTTPYIVFEPVMPRPSTP